MLRGEGKYEKDSEIKFERAILSQPVLLYISLSGMRIIKSIIRTFISFESLSGTNDSYIDRKELFKDSHSIVYCIKCYIKTRKANRLYKIKEK